MTNDPPNNNPPGAAADPRDLVRRALTADRPKRFYKHASIAPAAEAFNVILDGRVLQTPMKRALALPNQNAAALVAEEWNGQGSHIDLATMYANRLANTAQEGTARDPQAVFEDIVRFAGTDLLCYRVDSPPQLVALQRRYWDPVLDRVEAELHTRFDLVEGVMHCPQPNEAIRGFAAALGKHDTPVALTCLHAIATVTSSALLSLSLAQGWLDPDRIWAAAHVDEDWNISQWGADREATQRRAKRHLEFQATCALFSTVN